MTMHTLPASFGKGGSNLTDGTLHTVLKELQGLTVTVVAGAAAGTAMAVPALRAEDTLLAALITTDAGGAAANDVANMTIEATTASGTLTISGNPVNNETVTVNGVVYTFKTVATVATDVLIVAGNVTAMALNLATAINAYEGRYVETTGYRTPVVTADAALGVVTITAVADGVAGNAITLLDGATNVAATGAGTLIGGSATGGVKSTTELAAKTVTLFWYNKS